MRPTGAQGGSKALSGSQRDSGFVQQNAEAPAWLAQAALVILEGAPTQTALLDRDGKVLHVNAAWERFSNENGGDPRRTGTGQNYLHACRLAGDDGGDAYNAIKAVLDGNDAMRTVEYPCHSPKEKRWFRLRCIRVDAPPVAAAVVHDDLTDHYLAGEARRSLDREVARVRALEQEERRTTRALNTISHKLRTPLTPVRLQVATLGRKDLPESVAALVEKMRANTERLVDAVDEAVKAIELQFAPLKADPLHAIQAGKRLRSLLEDEAVLNNVSWHFHAGRDVVVDLPLVAAPVAELLRSAKALDPEGHAELDVDFDERTRLTIRHHGHAPTQGEPAEDGGDAGRGLAIYMCRAVARLHGGSFKVSSDKGEVSYLLDLPADPPKPTA